MPKNFKSETLSRILNDAKNAQPLDNNKRKNIYAPDEYLKKRAEILALDQMSNSEYLEPRLAVGAVEFDERGNLKEIGRNRPAMLDLAYYTRNRYEVERVIPANEKKMGLERGTYILVVLGNPIVKAITDTIELPKNVKAYRFKREEAEAEAPKDTEYQEEVTRQAVDEEGNPQVDEKGQPVMITETVTKTLPQGEKVKTYYWRYIGAEMILSERVYKMTRQLAPMDMMRLMDQIEGGINDGENVGGDKLDDIE